MRKPLSLKHKVRITGREIDLGHTDVRATFARARAVMVEKEKARQRELDQAFDEAMAEDAVRQGIEREQSEKVRAIAKRK